MSSFPSFMASNLPLTLSFHLQTHEVPTFPPFLTLQSFRPLLRSTMVSHLQNHPFLSSRYFPHFPTLIPKATSLPPTQQLICQFFKLFKLIVANVICFLALIYVLAWNAGNIGYHSYTVPNDLRWIAWFVHLDQSWR